RDIKRMLAYSSIEHMGLIALGAAIGNGLALAAVLLHILGHGLGKSVLFIGSGRIQQAAGSSRIDEVRGLGGQAPGLATLFGLGLLALLGLPPFSLFASELGIVRAGFAAGLGWAVAPALVLMLVIVAGVGGTAGRMLLGEAPPGAAGGLVIRLRGAGVPLVAGLVACAVLGVTLGPLRPLLESAATIATIGPPAGPVGAAR
ncbi:MAG TPA: proton-conducting transporter membrane subunit, partial [Nonomuraea sp.]|nr:proton-conducting transporter membrane subunit [Nonomuraea sp.]